MRTIVWQGGAGSAMTPTAKNDLRKALLIHQGAIGDFLVALRLISLCNTQFGPFRWDLLGKPPLGRLAKTLGLIEECHDFSIPGWHLFFSPDLPIPPECQSILNRYELMINVVAGPQAHFSRRLENTAPHRVISVEPRLPEKYSRHVYQYLAEQVMKKPVDSLPSSVCPVDSDTCLSVTQELRDRRIDPKRLMLIHPGASGENKRWPMENFLRLADSLNRQEITPAFLLGRVELEQFDEGTIKTLEKAGTLFADWPLERLAALISLSGQYFGNDNGVSHLAAVVGAQTQVVFVRNNAVNWKPLGPRVTILCAH
jgi:heptosyltransferase-3